MGFWGKIKTGVEQGLVNFSNDLLMEEQEQRELERREELYRRREREGYAQGLARTAYESSLATGGGSEYSGAAGLTRSQHDNLVNTTTDLMVAEVDKVLTRASTHVQDGYIDMSLPAEQDPSETTGFFRRTKRDGSEAMRVAVGDASSTSKERADLLKELSLIRGRIERYRDGARSDGQTDRERLLEDKMSQVDAQMESLRSITKSEQIRKVGVNASQMSKALSYAENPDQLMQMIELSKNIGYTFDKAEEIEFEAKVFNAFSRMVIDPTRMSRNDAIRSINKYIQDPSDREILHQRVAQSHLAYERGQVDKVYDQLMEDISSHEDIAQVYSYLEKTDSLDPQRSELLDMLSQRLMSKEEASFKVTVSNYAKEAQDLYNRDVRSSSGTDNASSRIGPLMQKEAGTGAGTQIGAGTGAGTQIGVGAQISERLKTLGEFDRPLTSFYREGLEIAKTLHPTMYLRHKLRAQGEEFELSIVEVSAKNAVAQINAKTKSPNEALESLSTAPHLTLIERREARRLTEELLEAFPQVVQDAIQDGEGDDRYNLKREELRLVQRMAKDAYDTVLLGASVDEVNEFVFKTFREKEKEGSLEIGGAERLYDAYVSMSMDDNRMDVPIEEPEITAQPDSLSAGMGRARGSISPSFSAGSGRSVASPRLTEESFGDANGSGARTPRVSNRSSRNPVTEELGKAWGRLRRDVSRGRNPLGRGTFSE